MTSTATVDVVSDRRRRLLPWAAAALFYVLLTIVQTWPLVIRLPDVLASDLGDPVLNTWIIWWNAHAVPLTERWWNAPMFWPAPGAITFSETLLGLAPLTTPIQWIGGSAVTAYNLVFLLTFALSAIAAHALIFGLTARHDAAVLGALIYAFNPFRVAHFPQVQLLACFWMPIGLLALHRYLGDGRRRWLWIFGAAWLMQALTNLYYLLFFPVLIVLWITWFLPSRRSLKPIVEVVLAWMAASLPLIPLLWTFRRVHGLFGFHRNFLEITGFSADVTALLDCSPLLKFWRLQWFHTGEGDLFPGSIAPLLVLLLIVTWFRAPRLYARVPRACLTLLLASIAFVAVAFSAILIGPWAVRIGHLTLVTVGTFTKPLSMAILLFFIALAFEPRIGAAWRRGSPELFYVLAALTMYLLALGPEPRFMGVVFMYRSPYGWLMRLPGYDSIRVPARFAMLGVLCLAVAAALAFSRLTANRQRFVQLGMATVLVGGVLIDSWLGEMPLPTLPARSPRLESLSTQSAVLELPLGDPGDDLQALYRSMYHRRPLVNGYSGFFPRHFDVLRAGLDARDPRMFDAVTVWGPVAVAVRTDGDPGGTWLRQIADRPDAVPLGEERGRRVFLLQASPRPPDADHLRPLDVRSAWSSVHNDQIAFALDGNPETRWESGPQRGVETVTIDLGASRTVEALSMTIGEHVNDFPRALLIESSNDERTWTTAWEGTTAAVAFLGAAQHPREVPLTFVLPHPRARWLRLRQLGNDPVYYWSIFELRIFGS